MKSVLVWDFPTRLFHWLLVVAIAAAYISGDTGGNWMVWHGRIGILIVGLISFRLVWGVAGSTYARFGTFVRGPATIKAYLAGKWHGLGHNPLGALSVLGLLGLVALQAGTGLFAQNDDTSFAGPFYALVSGPQGELATRLHHKVLDVLLVLIGLHLLAILFYTHVRKDKLLKPMLTGRKEVAAGESARGGGPLAFIVAVLVAGGITFAASGIWIDKPPPPPPAATPAW